MIKINILTGNHTWKTRYDRLYLVVIDETQNRDLLPQDMSTSLLGHLKGTVIFSLFFIKWMRKQISGVKIHADNGKITTPWMKWRVMRCRFPPKAKNVRQLTPTRNSNLLQLELLHSPHIIFSLHFYFIFILILFMFQIHIIEFLLG